MAVKPVVYDDTTKKHRPLGSGEKMDGLSASSIVSSQSGNLITTGSDGLAYATGSGIADPSADNLLETTSSGKLKMDIDRLAEWLDGHPSDAKIFSEAINVVSSDSGNVIAKGSDKGAFLARGDISSAVSGMTDAQKQQLASALADGTTITASGGRLRAASQSGDASALADGQTIVAQSGKIKVNYGAGLAYNSQSGKLEVVFNDLTADQVLELCKPGGGIGGDSEGLFVDFDSMPTDKFEAMLKSLKMLVPLDGNKTLYVSVNNANAVVPSVVGGKVVYPDGCGTVSKPFKRIQDCVNYATSTYAVGNYHIVIRVVAGTYPENVTLPNFSRGTGYIEILSDSGARDVDVVAQTSAAGSRGWCFNASGGDWRLRHVRAVRVESATAGKGQAFGCYNVTGGGRLNLYGCAADQSFPADFPDAPGDGNQPYEIRLFCADSGAELRLQHDVLPGSISSAVNTVSVTNPDTQETSAVNDQNHRVYVFSINRGASLWLTGAYDEDADPDTTGVFNCSGSFDAFLMMRQNAGVTVYGGGTLTSFSGTVSGKRYALYGGSYVAGSDRIATNPEKQYFPGDVAGTSESISYCWYHE